MTTRNDELQGVMEKHRDQLRYRMPAQLKTDLAESFQASRLEAPASIPRPSPSGRWLAAAAAVAALVAGVVIGRTWEPGAPQFQQEIVSGHVRSLMANHLFDVASTDQHTVKPWFEGKLDFGPTVLNLDTQGFPLIGGRLDYAGNRSVAVLIYKRNQHVINVYEWPSAQAESTPRFSTLRGFNIYLWDAGGISFAAVSDLNALEMQQFASLWTKPPP